MSIPYAPEKERADIESAPTDLIVAYSFHKVKEGGDGAVRKEGESPLFLSSEGMRTKVKKIRQFSKSYWQILARVLK